MPPATEQQGLLSPPQIIKIAVDANGGGELLALDYDACERIYQVKLIRDGVVTLIYVSAVRPGQIVGKVGG